MRRVLAPAGGLVLTTPIRYTEAPLDRMHVREWSPDAFRQFCRAELGVPVALKLPHPIALAEMYASDARLLGRSARLVMNGLTKLGHNPFTRGVGFRAYSTQTAIARKPS